MELDAFAKRLRDLKTKTADDQREASEHVRFGAILLGALLAGVAQFVQLSPPLMPWVHAVGVGGAVLAFIGGYWVYRADRHAAQSLELADEAIEAARASERRHRLERSEALEAFAAIRDEHLHQRQLFAATAILREGIERAIAHLPCPSVDEVLKKILKGCLRTLLACLRCEAGERWTLTVYREQGGILRGAAAFTVDREEDDVSPREWAIGEGYAGAAFARDREVVLHDAQNPSVLALLHVPTDKLRPQDAAKYRSLAAVPVRVAGIDRPWGVVIATSDKLGRFDSSETGEGAISAQAIRMVAGMIALLAAAEIKVCHGENKN